MSNIAVCCPGENFSSRWVRNWTNLFTHLIQQQHGVYPIFDFSSNVYHTRNMMADLCKSAPDLDYVLWIDDDNIFDPLQFDRLMGELAAHPEADALFGWSWCEKDQYEAGAMISCGQVNEDGADTPLMPGQVLGQTKLIEVGYSGFPVALMRAELLKTAGENAFAPIVSPQYVFGYSGEDFAFCRRAIAAGARLFVDPVCQVPHLKQRAIEPKHLLKFWANEQKAVVSPESKQEECAA